MDTILFDLDGTLLPLRQDAFVESYMGLLGRKAEAFGFEAKPLLKALWQGTGEMMKNDGAMSNRHRFWNRFALELGENIREMEPVFDSFYAQEFHAVRDTARANPLAREVVDMLRGNGYTVALATNPLFPAVAVDSRLSWVGLKREDFALITDYGNSRFCKPSAGYYLDILRELGKQPADCLMVGNSVAEDLPALNLGIAVYLVTDCLEGEGEYGHVPHGGFADFAEFARQLPVVTK